MAACTLKLALVELTRSASSGMKVFCALSALGLMLIQAIIMQEVVSLLARNVKIPKISGLNFLA